MSTQARVLAVVEHDALSPYPFPPALAEQYPGTARWEDVLTHLAQRLEWLELGLCMDVFTQRSMHADAAAFNAAADKADLLLAVDVQDVAWATELALSTMTIPTSFALNCAETLEEASRLHYLPAGLLDQAARWLPWSQSAKDASMRETVAELYERRNPNDFLFLILVLLNACVTPIKAAEATPKDLSLIWCMMKNCRTEITACISDPDCKAALDCLEGCGLNDQVCSYRCIVSHESPLFEAFSLCNLQKHNCLGHSAERPRLPEVGPMASFRGQTLTHELAEEIFIGWMRPTLYSSAAATSSSVDSLDALEWSWKVVCGVNPAYDYFPCQHQIFYHLKGGKSFWYDPVFKVETMNGEVVWRRRHYRVKRDKVPGTFFFSVLDNGVTSLEFWRIVDVAEDLSWAVFYYSGAASAAGQAYSGAVFCTPDGDWPAAQHLPRVTAALKTCGIELWELYQVDNSCCAGAPLGLLDA